MRSIGLILVTTVVLVGLFVGYWRWSAGSTPMSSDPARPTSVPVRDTDPGSGQGVWVKMYDARTGRLTQQFRAERYEPHGGGVYHVTRPEAEFFFATGPTTASGSSPTSQPSSPQVVRVVGVEGDINTVPGDTDPTLGSALPASSPPSRGILQDVTISMYPDAMSAARDQADMTFTMANLEFDNDTFRIFTPGDAHTAPDRVEVHGYGTAADFDGEGLEVRWDEVAHRLLSLEIAHGHYLTVKNAAAMGMSAGGDNGRPGRTGDGGNAGAAVSAGPVGNPISAAGNSVGTAATPGVVLGSPSVATSRASTMPATGQLYRADFHDNVRVVQGGVEKITADVMHVDFVSGSTAAPASPGPAARSGGGSTELTAGGSTGLIAGDAAGGGATAGGGGGGASGGGGSSAGVGPAGANPVADAGTGPVQVQWTGILLMVPLDGESSGPLPAAGKAIVRLDGNPVHVHDGLGQVAGAQVTYWGSDGSALVEGTTGVPVELTDSSAQGMAVIDAAWMRFDGSGHVATLGPGKAQIHGKPATAGSAGQVIDASWTRQVTVNMTPSADGTKMDLQHARLEGKVDVRDSTGMHVSGDSMDLAFDPSLATGTKSAPATGGSAVVATGGQAGATLTHAVVDTGARCEMTDADGTKKTISGDEISMDMAHEDGQAYAKHVNADGSVVVTTPDGRLEGAHLESDLLPGDVGTKAAGSTGLPSTALGAGTSGGAKLDRLLVTGGVTLTGQNGVKATGDELEVETTEVGQTIVLTGVPAKATDGVSILSGPSITMMPAGQQATVSGAGTLVTTTKAGSGLLPNGAPAAKGQAVSAPLTAGAAKPQPVTITWTQDATLDVNVLDVHGSVDLKTRGDDGADEEATADRMSLTLADKAPTTAPVKNAGATNGPSTRDAADPLNVANMGALGDKQVTAARLIGNAKVHSVLTGADGKLLRMQSMKADEIDNDMISQTMTVPGPGELGVVDNPPPGQPAAGAKGAGGSTPLTAGGSTGLTTGGSTGLTAGGSVGTPGNSGGTTAFSWSRQLVYDMVKGQATMDGPSATTTAPAKNGGAVLVVHQDRATPPMLTTMSAKQLIATFGTGATAANGAQQLKSMTASGAVQVNVKSRGYIIEGGTLQYDPIAQYIVVKGTDEWPGSVHDAQGLKNSPFSVLDLDEQTGRMKLTGPNGQTDP